MNNQDLQSSDYIPFPLLTKQYIDELQNNDELKCTLNTKLLSLSHKCQYKWDSSIKSDWEVTNQIKMLVITWNMHGMMPGYSLKRLFQIGTVHHDLIVIGSQECLRSIGYSLFCESKDQWETKLSGELGKQYVKVQSVSLNAMHLIIFAHISVVPKIRSGKELSLSQGFLNIVGNKGGIGLQIRMNDKIFIFINSHLESGQNSQQQRCNQFQKLETHMESKTIEANLQYDYLIWTGDFNSRIDMDISIKAIRFESDFYRWISNDQLYKSRMGDPSFQNKFKEGMIFFPPTYKLEPSHNSWCSGKDFRVPGWTDRIVFKENTKDSLVSSNRDVQQVRPIQQKNSNNLRLHNYDCNYDILGSDHRPVFAQFSVII